MKRLFTLLMVVLSVILWNCGGSDDDKDIQNPDNGNIENPDNNSGTKDSIILETSVTQLTFKSTGGKQQFTIECNRDWKITNNNSYIQLDKTFGSGNSTISVTGVEYWGDTDMTAELVIEAENKTIKVIILIKHRDYLLVTWKKFDVPQEGGNVTVEFKSNIEYDVTIPPLATSWIRQLNTRALKDEKILFYVSPNYGNDRQARIVIKDKNSSLSDTIIISQETKIYNGNITFRSNSDIENFRSKGYKQIKGSVKIETSGITSLSSLSNINTIEGELEIYNCPYLTNLDGLDNIYKISGFITISHCPILTSLEGLHNVSGKVGQLKIDNCERLTSLNGLNNITETSNSVMIEVCPLLTSLEGLYNLSKIGIALTIRRCDKLTSLRGLSNLRELWDINIDNCPLIASLEGLNNLTEIRGFDIKNCNSLQSLQGLNNLRKLSDYLGSINIENCPQLISIKALEHMTRISGSFWLTKCDALSTLKGLENITSVGSLNIDCNALTSLEGLNNITTIGYSSMTGGGISIVSKNLLSLEALNKLRSIGGNLRLYKCDKLISLKGLDNITQIREGIDISRCDALQTLEGVENVTSIGEKIYITNCPKLSDFTALKSALMSFNGKYTVDRNAYNPKKEQILSGQGKQ